MNSEIFKIIKIKIIRGKNEKYKKVQKFRKLQKSKKTCKIGKNKIFTIFIVKKYFQKLGPIF